MTIAGGADVVAGRWVRITVPLTAGQVLQFRSVKASLTVPAAYDEDISTMFTEYAVIGMADSNSSLPGDPGQWVRMLPDRSGAFDALDSRRDSAANIKREAAPQLSR